MKLRAATPADAAAVADVLITSREAFLPYAPSAHSDDEVRAWVRETLLPQEAVTVCEDEGRIVGIAAVHADADATWITQMYVRPGSTGRGIGARLLAHALAAARLPVRLYTFQQNASARRFYEERGFVAVAFSDGSGNEERCPDVLYELASR